MGHRPFVSTFNGVFVPLAAGIPLPTPTSVTNLSGNIPQTISLSFRPSYLEQFNLLVQKELAGNVLTLGYVGMNGRRLAEQLPDINAAPANTAANPNTLRPFYSQLPNVTAISQVRTEGASSYNAFQASLSRRLRSGLTLDANYNYSHNIDDVVNLSGGNSEFGGYGAFPNEVSTYERGNSDLDLRERVAIMADYELPFGKNLNGAKGLLAKGWQVNFLSTFSTGLPLSVQNSTDRANTLPGDNQGDRPNVVGKLTSHPSAGCNVSYPVMFNVCAFAPQPLETQGNASRNMVPGPHFRHADMSLFKDIPVRESATLQFRAEFFNISNTPNFVPGTSTYTLQPTGPTGPENGGFGSINTLNPNYTPREIQFALKLEF